MILKVSPAGFIKGTVDLPASKSYSIRVFIVASCGGTSSIRFPSDCDDALVAVSAARALGAKISRSKRNIWKVTASQKISPRSRIDVGESGTVLRFLLPLASVRMKSVTVTGQGTLVGRPNKYLTRALRQAGFKIRGRGSQESVPIRIEGGHFDGGRIDIDGTVSSQFVSALLIACPLLVHDSCLMIKGEKIVSEDYVTMTRQILARSGVRIQKKGKRVFYVPGRQTFKGLKNFTVPSDYGLAAFLMAAAALIPSKVTLKGFLKNDFIQSDGHSLRFFRKMGVRFQKSLSSIKMAGVFVLKGGSFSLKNCPDLLPIMAVMALFSKGRTRLYDIGHARVKESDRISDLRLELLKIGANISEKKNELIIYPKSTYKNNVLLDPHNDHRLAMAFAILGLKIGVRVKDIECVSKSYPGFVRDLRKISAPVAKI